MRTWRFALESSSQAAGGRRSQLSFEPLEELLLLSAVGWESDYDQWRQQTFSIDGLFSQDVGVDRMVFSTDTQSVSGQANQSLQLIGGNQVHQNYGYTGSGYTVAILDTGIDYTHSALASSYIGGWDFVDNDADPMDLNGHGTHVAGIIASTDATYRGVAPDVNIIALRVLDGSGSGSFGDVEAALRWVANHQAQFNIVAVNMSLGSGNFSANPWTFMEDELAVLESQGVFVAAASGNSFYTYGSQTGLGYPAISTRTVSVGAVWDAAYGPASWGSGGRDYSTGADRITSFTQRSSGLDILAPGAFIRSTYIGGGWASLAGTSMAAPVVAGGAVLIHQAMDAAGLGHLANQDTILQVMQETGVTVVDGDDENDNVSNTWLSFRRLDVAAAVSSLGSHPPEPPPIDDNQIESFVTAVYQELLGRNPDAAGLAYWTAQVNSGVSRTAVSHAIWVSPEFKGFEIDSYYAEIFNRAPQPEERNYWTNVLINSPSDTFVPKALLTSGEYSALHPGNGAFVGAAYLDVLGRSADAGGMLYWSEKLTSGGSRAAIAESLLTSAEFRLGAIDGYYQDFLGRTPGQTERMWWLSNVESGAMALRSIGELFLGSDEYLAKSGGSAGSTGVTSSAGATGTKPSSMSADDELGIGMWTGHDDGGLPSILVSPGNVTALTHAGSTIVDPAGVDVISASEMTPVAAAEYTAQTAAHDLLTGRSRGWLATSDDAATDTVKEIAENWPDTPEADEVSLFFQEFFGPTLDA